MGQPLRNRCRDAHADERAGTIAQDDSIEISRAEPVFGQHLPDHGNQQSRVFALLLFVSLGNTVTVGYSDRSGQLRRIDS